MANRGNGIEVVSFDVEGTITTTDFSSAIWFEMLPQRYALKHGLDFNQAVARIKLEYDSVGDQQPDWYDVQYWFTRFGLGRADIAMEELQGKVVYFPEVTDVLETLGRKYRLSVASGSPRPFLHHLLRDVRHRFSHVFSSISDFRQVKTADFYRAMCSELAVEPCRVLHIGDNRQFDFLEPASIGIRAFHLDREGNSPGRGSLKSLAGLVPLLDS